MWLFHLEWEVVLVYYNILVKRNLLQEIGAVFNWMNQLAKMMEPLMVFSTFNRLCFYCLQIIFSWILLLLGISIVHQIMVYLFLWRKYHCLHWHVNRVCRVPVPRNHLLQSAQWAHWAALHQQIRLVCEWALRYRSPPIALFTVHTERHRNYSITSIISLFVYCFDCIFAN